MNNEDDARVALADAEQEVRDVPSATLSRPVEPSYDNEYTML